MSAERSEHGAVVAAFVLIVGLGGVATAVVAVESAQKRNHSSYYLAECRALSRLVLDESAGQPAMDGSKPIEFVCTDGDAFYAPTNLHKVNASTIPRPIESDGSHFYRIEVDTVESAGWQNHGWSDHSEADVPLTDARRMHPGIAFDPDTADLLATRHFFQILDVSIDGQYVLGRPS